jgi:hypothetical protein
MENTAIFLAIKVKQTGDVAYTMHISWPRKLKCSCADKFIICKMAGFKNSNRKWGRTCF